MRHGGRRATSATTPPQRPQSSASDYRRRLLEDVPEHRLPAARDAAVVEATLAGAYPTSLLGAPGAAEGHGAPAAGHQLGSFLKRNMSAEKVKRTTLRYVRLHTRIPRGSVCCSEGRGTRTFNCVRV